MSGSMGLPSAFDESLLLAEALERALGNGDTPSNLTGPALTELSSLVIVVRRLEASTHTSGPSDAFRTAGRMRLVATIRETAALSASRVRQPRRQPWCLRVAFSTWFARVAATLSAVALAGAATASASASALPGDPLYGIKQAAEQVALVTAVDGAARQQVLVRQADARLEETSRLLEQGRDAEAGQNALRYSEVLERATGAVGATEPVETTLQADTARLASLLAAAAPPARQGLQRALEAAERGLVRARRAAPPDVHVLPQPPPPAVVQQVADVRTEARPTTASTAGPTPITLGASGRAVAPKRAQASGEVAQRPEPAEPRAEQSLDDAVPETVEGGHAAGGLTRPIGPPERSQTSGPPEHPAPSAPGVDKPRGAPFSEVQPARHGRP
jgi:Domain of unknown function (DUF5667)